MSGIKSFVVGATGAVGKEVVNVLSLNEAFSKVTIIGRRNLDLDAEKYKKVDQLIVDFDKLDDYAHVFQGFDVGFCCLGTTKGKAGTAGFIKVDHDYVVNSAKLAKQGGCKDFHLVTAQGSNKNSWFLYPKTKGLVEQEVTDMAFNRLSIYRPGLLLCEREERRPFEKILQVTIGALDRWEKVSTPTETVAQAMVKNALQSLNKPVEIIEHDQIVKLAKA